MSGRCARFLAFLSPLSLIGLIACFGAPVAKPAPQVIQQTNVRVEQSIKNRVDLLFMIDDSSSMSAKQSELRGRFQDLIKIIDQNATTNPAWYHIGVITSDLGSASYSDSQCHSTGKRGALQNVGAAAAQGCQGPVGYNFIDYNQLPLAQGQTANNLPLGHNLVETFTCMASVGDQGCGLEHQLEAVYQALHNPPAENHDFLRSEALLAVVFLTDEDDCSADPNTTLFDNSSPGVATYGVLNSYRCTRFGIECINPDTGVLGPLPYGTTNSVSWTGCVSRPASAGGKLFDLSRYTNFFNTSRGVKTDPDDVILFGITAPDSGGAQVYFGNRSGTPCTPPNPNQFTADCSPILAHSCNVGNFAGDPAVRIRAVINSKVNPKTKSNSSVCDTDYTGALQTLGDLITSNIGAGCIDSPFDDPNNPDCLVEDDTTTADGVSIKQIPFCGHVNNATPCWRLKQNSKCTATCAKANDPPQQYGVDIDRGKDAHGNPNPPPPATTAHVACSTLALAKPLPVCAAR